MDITAQRLFLAKRRLRVKIKSLAEEARIIRQEERFCLDKKVSSWIYNDLYLHRIREVRTETRYALLAYAFLRGRSFSSVEQKSCLRWFSRDRLVKLINRMYRNDDLGLEKRVSEWLAAREVATA